MFKLHVVQAENGDCLILEFGTPSQPGYILIDGGPETIYDKHLRDELLKIRDSGGKVGLVILSHVDNDHIVGLLDLMAELRQQRANNETETIGIDSIWHNSFSQTIGGDSDIEPRLKLLLASADEAGRAMRVAGMAVDGIGEGNQLRLAAAALGLPVNPGFANGVVCATDSPEAVLVEDLSLNIVGPTRDDLEELQREWLDWLRKYEDAIPSGDPFLAAMADRSVPNLSSIMVLADVEGKKALLTGDGRGDHLLNGLAQTNLLGPQGTLHVDVLKIPHHGSDRNVTRKLFKAITADQYVISANGKDGNPDLATLIWVVEAAQEQGRSIEIFVTNQTPSTQRLVEDYPPSEYGYRLTEMEKEAHSSTLQIAP